MLQVHLLSLPWCVKHIPSIQIAGLKAFLHRHRPDLAVRAHHLHLSIPSEVFSEDRYWSSIAKNFHEGYYLYLLARRFGHRFQLPSPETLYEEIRDHAVKQRKGFEFLSLADLDELARVTDKYLEESVVASAKNASKILIGMTTNFLQTYSNVYAYAYLEERLAEKNPAFVLGGSSVSYPQVVATLSRLKLKAFAIVGEGENKLLKFVERFEADKPLEDLTEGVFSLDKPVDLTTWNDSWHASQVKSFSDLPDPDFTEYFEALDLNLKGPDWARMRKRVEIPLEGSRGCVFSCEFCNLNRFWEGYRKRPGQEIAQRALALTRRYGVSRVRFVDNLCDGWARDYAQELIDSGETISSVMEMRPKHEESFWDALAKSGLHECQIGVEGLDDEILKRVKKNTNVMDIAFNQKILTEKQIFRGFRQLISFYPKSTVDEVANTRTMLELLLHMPRFGIGGFALGVDSPLYKELPKETQLKLHVTSDYASALPRWREDLSVHFYLENPPEIAPTPEAVIEWRKLVNWYEGISPAHWVHNCLSIEGYEIRDSRSGEEIVYDLSPDQGRVYEQCHSPVSLEKIQELTSFSTEKAERILAELSAKKLLLIRNGKYLALALRISAANLSEIRKQKFYGITR